MLFQEDRTPIVPKGKKNHGEWPENYFAEFDPAARKAILDKQRNEEVDETLECLEKLFALRYKQEIMQTSFWDSSCSFESQRKIWMQCFQNGKTEKQSDSVWSSCSCMPVQKSRKN